MKDKNGLYYHAQAGNPNARVYVRKGKNEEIEFRLWEASHPEVWESHGWLPLSVIREAAKLYQKERNPDSDPTKLYDANIAAALLREDHS